MAAVHPSRSARAGDQGLRNSSPRPVGALADRLYEVVFRAVFHQGQHRTAEPPAGQPRPEAAGNISRFPGYAGRAEDLSVVVAAARQSQAVSQGQRAGRSVPLMMAGPPIVPLPPSAAPLCTVVAPLIEPLTIKVPASTVVAPV